MKKFIFLILSLINAMAIAVYIALCPLEVVPTHYGPDGTADAFGSKWTMLIMALIPVLVAIIYAIVSTILKNKESYKTNKRYENRVIAVIFVMLFIFCWVFTIPTLNNMLTISGELVMPLIMMVLGIVMIIMSNVLPKLKQNWSFGIKVRGTLKSENVWKKTHKFAGYTGVVAGVLVVLMNMVSFFVPAIAMIVAFISLAVILLGVGIIPTIYAEVLYSKEKKLNVNRE